MALAPLLQQPFHHHSFSSVLQHVSSPCGRSPGLLCGGKERKNQAAAAGCCEGSVIVLGVSCSSIASSSSQAVDPDVGGGCLAVWNHY